MQQADAAGRGGGPAVEAAVAAREIWRGLRAADHAAVARLLAGLSAAGVLRAEAVFDAAIAPTAGASLRVLLAQKPLDPERARALRSLAAARWEPSAGEVRDRLEVLLAGDGRAVRRGLGRRELAVASAHEKVALLGKLLAGAGSVDERILFGIVSSCTGGDGAQVLVALHALGRLREFLDAFRGETLASLLVVLPSLAGTPAAAAALAMVLAETGDRKIYRLAIHHVLDRSRAGGFLAATLAQIHELRPDDALLEQLAREAQPRRLPRIIARGVVPAEFPPNTLPTLIAAMCQGADGFEIDVALTADDELVLWHEYGPGPPVHELDLAAFRRNVGCVGAGGGGDVEIPLLERVLRLLDRHPHLELHLDLQIPENRPDLEQRWVRRIEGLFAASELARRALLLLHGDAGVVRRLRARLGPAAQVLQLSERDALAVEAIEADGAEAAEAGAVRGTPIESMQPPAAGAPRGVLRHDGYRAAGESEERSRSLGIERELELRARIGLGCDWILTDRPAELRALLRALGREDTAASPHGPPRS